MIRYEFARLVKTISLFLPTTIHDARGRRAGRGREVVEEEGDQNEDIVNKKRHARDLWSSPRENSSRLGLLSKQSRISNFSLSLKNKTIIKRNRIKGGDDDDDDSLIVG